MSDKKKPMLTGNKAADLIVVFLAPALLAVPALISIFTIEFSLTHLILIAIFALVVLFIATLAILWILYDLLVRFETIVLNIESSNVKNASEEVQHGEEV